MKCPKCSNMESKVVDSRAVGEGNMTRRRRECISCNERFTTYERIESTPLLVIKKDGTRQEFDRGKILTGIRLACRKRPISLDQMEALVDKIEKSFQDAGEKEISAVTIGETVVRELYHLDGVAYVRFASVYRDFKDANEFLSEIKNFVQNKEDH